VSPVARGSPARQNGGMKDLWRLARNAERAERYAVALVAFRRLVSDEEFGFAARLYLVDVLAHLGRHDDSKAMLEELDALAPKEADTRRAYARLVVEGKACQARGDFAGAAAVFRRAAEVFRHTAPLIHLGGTLWHQGNLDDAEAAYRLASSAEGDVDEALENLGYLLRARERNEEALTTLRRALELDPANKRVAAAIKDIEEAIAMARSTGGG